ncbi:MAG: hypothetical protein HC856_10765 [Pseudanabaena sp. RU_4_16]|nr:hypothetical protein [Pseudanabaena sp. RU_4_16]
MELQKPISNLIDLVESFPDREQLSILFIVGLEKSLVEYIRPGYGGAGDYYNLDTVPPILSHLNWQRENFRDRFRHLCFVFLLPRFAIKYILRRAPDFFDWGSGVFEFPTESSNLESAFFSLRSERTTEEDYLALTRKQRIEKLLEIQEMIDEPNQSSDQKAELYCEQGLIHAISSEFEEAIASFDKVLQIKPDNHEALRQPTALRYGTLGR